MNYLRTLFDAHTTCLAHLKIPDIIVAVSNEGYFNKLLLISIQWLYSHDGALAFSFEVSKSHTELDTR
jgi:hypothetical protein